MNDGIADSMLIRAIVADGSEAAARHLVDRHSPRLLAVAVRTLGGDVETADDVLQQSWIKAIRALPRPATEVLGVEVWIGTTPPIPGW